MSQQNQLEPTGFTTRTIHAVHDARYDASVPPVYLASTFGTAGEDTTYMYQRGANPTRDNLQATLAALEGPSTLTRTPPAWRHRGGPRRSGGGRHPAAGHADLRRHLPLRDH